MDTLVTGVILGGVVATIYGINKKKKKKLLGELGLFKGKKELVPKPNLLKVIFFGAEKTPNSPARPGLIKRVFRVFIRLKK